MRHSNSKLIKISLKRKVFINIALDTLLRISIFKYLIHEIIIFLYKVFVVDLILFEIPFIQKMFWINLSICYWIMSSSRSMKCPALGCHTC